MQTVREREGRWTEEGGGRRELDLIRLLKMEEFPATLNVVMPLRGGDLTKYAKLGKY